MIFKRLDLVSKQMTFTDNMAHDEHQTEYNKNDDNLTSNHQYSSILIQKLQFNKSNVPNILIKFVEEDDHQKFRKESNYTSSNKHSFGRNSRKGYSDPSNISESSLS